MTTVDLSTQVEVLQQAFERGVYATVAKLLMSSEASTEDKVFSLALACLDLTRKADPTVMSVWVPQEKIVRFCNWCKANSSVG